tara:strand:- start:364 stop:645 length:282 start_codon:yes stop_codon:yes gene_type:complete
MINNNLSNNVSNFDYRVYLTRHGLKNHNFNIINNKYNNVSKNNTPFLYNSISDTSKPQGYINSDLKDKYMNIENRKVIKNNLNYSSPLETIFK